MSEHLTFPGMPEPVAPPKPMSADRKRTLRRQALLDAGRHPLFGDRQHDNPDSRCGNCEHHAVKRVGNTFHKCVRTPNTYTGGPATDIRVSWPGCEHWEAAS